MTRLRAAASALVIAVVLCAAASVYDLDDYPPQFDYDAATRGIFVNNLTFNGRYDYGFNPQFSQDAYRMSWAAQFLPVSVPLSWVQRAVGIRFADVGELMKWTGLALGFLGCLVAARALEPAAGGRAIEVAFVVAFTVVFPAFILYLRTAVPCYMLGFLLFWAVVALVARWCRGREPWCLYALAATVAYYALVPYPPLVVAPIVAAWLLVRAGALRRLVVDRHFYGAALLGVALYFGAGFGIAVTHARSYAEYRERVVKFVTDRSGKAFALDRLGPSDLAAKARKLLDQHVLFQRDELGDTTREDHLWTVGAPHPGWLVLLPLAIVGAWRGARARDPGAELALAVVGASFAVAFLVSFPEGRYLLTVVPCYAYFTMRGLGSLLRRPALRIAGLATALLVMAIGTCILVGGQYNAFITARWWNMGGMRAVMTEIRTTYGNPSPVYINWPDLRYHEWLYLEMLGNFRVSSTDDVTLLGMAARNGPKTQRYFIVRQADAQADIRRLTAAGFFKIGAELTDAETGRHVVLLVSG